MFNPHLMTYAISLSKKHYFDHKYTPFGAIIVKDGSIVGKGASSVVKNGDPTDHAEVIAIRNASRTLGTHDLSGAIMYASGYPCPFCLTASSWANVSEIYYAATLEDSSHAGFEDLEMYNQLGMYGGFQDGDVFMKTRLHYAGDDYRADALVSLADWKKNVLN